MRLLLSCPITLRMFVHEGASDPVYWTTSQQVRQKGQQEGGEYGFDRIEPLEDEELKQHIENHRQR